LQKLSLLIRRNRIYVAGAFLTAVLSNLSQMVYVYFIGELVNRIEARTSIGTPLFVILGCFLLSNAFTLYLNQYVGHYASEKMAHELRMGYAAGILRNTMSRNGVSNVATAMSAAQNELAQATDYLTNTFFDIYGMLITGILAFVFLMFQNVLLTLIILIPTVLIMIYVYFSGRKLTGIVTTAQNEKNLMNKAAYGLISAFPVIKVFDGKDLCVDAYSERLMCWEKQAEKKERLAALYNTLSGILSRVPLLLMFLVGGYMVLSGKMLLGTLVVFLNLQNSLKQTIMNLPNWMSGFKVFLVNLSRIEIV